MYVFIFNFKCRRIEEITDFMILYLFRVVPQAICTRFGLAIGATLAP